MKSIRRIAIYICMLTFAVGGIGSIGFINTMNDSMSLYENQTLVPAQQVLPPTYDPNKPTVAVLLANEVTEVFDFLVPYEIFAMTEAYNVVAVAPDRNVKSLTGGLDVVPHHSFAEMDQILGKSPDIIVIPYMPILDEKKYQPVREWIKKNSGSKTTLITICNGAENLAETGLLNGKSAATHWGDIGRLEKKYPQTHWERDHRYVADGNVVSSAGLTSGIDAVLFVISEQLGEAMAANVAKQLNYPSYGFVQNPYMTPYYAGLSDIDYVVNNAFQWNKKKAGVLLYNGVDEAALASVFDTYSASGTTNTITVSSADKPIMSKYRLNLIARYQIAHAPGLDKMIVAGTEAQSLAAGDIQQWKDTSKSAETLLLHRNEPAQFAMAPALEDLAKQEDVRTASFAAKRLEYRATGQLKLEGSPFSYEAYGNLLLVGVISLCIALLIDRRFIRKRK
ncbi:DJ-1/PfpI family protein [Paenibacillus sp. SI8]|uniref:DJ-1/PfpI family protein n=1 Tax=unclassified Paenibacillus TaxID=185978 RepID=UPI0034677936